MTIISTIILQAFFAHTASDNDVIVNILQRLGNLHPPAVHFPIALIIMTLVSEILYYLTSSVIYLHSSRFMIIAAALTAIQASLLGLSHGYIESLDEYIFWWHRFCGLTTTSLVAVTAVIKELYSRNFIKKNRWYYIFLSLSFIFVSITGYLGGELHSE